MTGAELAGDEPDQKRTATRRLGDPVPPPAPGTKRKPSPARKRKKARR